MKNTLLITTFTALAAAQTIADLPTCSLQCLSTAISGLECGLTDFACSCQKADQLTPIVTPCVRQACTDPTDQSKTIKVLSAICAAAGFPIEAPAPPASSVVPQPTSEDGFEPTSEALIETQPSETEDLDYSEYPTATDTASEYPAPSHAPSDISNLPSSYSDFIPLPSFVDTVVVPRPSPHPSLFPSVLPPFPTGTFDASVPAPSGTGAPPSPTSSHLPEFTGAAAVVKVNAFAAGLLGLAAFLL